MAIDSVRLLTDSAGQLWQRLSSYGRIDSLPDSSCFEDWIDGLPRLARGEEQLLRRDYRRLCTLLDEIETLVRSKSRAIELVRARAAGSDE